LRRRVLAQDRGGDARGRRGGGDHRLRRHPQRARLLGVAVAADPSARPRRPRPAGAARRARAGDPLRPRRDQRPDPPGHGAVEAPMLAVVEQFHPHWLGQTLKYVVAAAAVVTLVAAAQSAMLGLSRLAYSLATNRQIPSAVGRLHPTRSTPYVVIAIAAVLAI